MEKISCCLITKKTEYPKIIMERLTLGFFDEILIHTECPNVYGRYELAKQAKNEIIYFQDDDCLVNYQVLFSKFNGQLTNTMTLPFQKKYEPLGCTLMGWGSFIKKEMIENALNKYINEYGLDDEHLYRETDRIVSYLNRPFNTIIQPHEDLFQDEERMSSPSNYEAHMKSAMEAIRKCSML